VSILTAVLLLLMVGALGWTVYWIRGTARTEAALESRDEELELERAHRAAQDRAAATDRAERAEDFNEAAVAVRDPGSAGDLLRDRLSRYEAE
jgi:hypothetical protein